MSSTEHTVTFTADGPTDVTHPANEAAGCDFEDYLDSDWSAVMDEHLGPWRFQRMDGYWNGSM